MGTIQENRLGQPRGRKKKRIAVAGLEAQRSGRLGTSTDRFEVTSASEVCLSTKTEAYLWEIIIAS